MTNALPGALASAARFAGVLALAVVVVSVVERLTGAHQTTTGPASLTGPNQQL
ncbi:hypothetical protein ABH922_001245 [Rhodococcus sp. 27YEA15]|uniref:hypothetical protein n=1 Tax=Rhodococcus sp. 27YEA15 TaxID=3156259 RepID=UPI003C7D8D82